MRTVGYRIAAAAVLTATVIAVVAVRTAASSEAVALGPLMNGTPALAPVGDTPADLAVQFEALLGQHAVLAADLMRSRIRGDPDFVQSANAALGNNTDDMTALVTKLFGGPTGQKFKPLWTKHILELFAYAGALADHNADAKKDAYGELVEYEGDLASFFSGASQGRLPLSTAHSLVAMHIQHLTTQADAYSAGNYALADDLYREGFEHTYDLGLGLANALLPPADSAVLTQPVWRLRSQLGRLLAEHAVLIEDTTRAAVSGTPDFTASGQMLNANTSDISAAIDTLFGAAAAKQFQQLWGTHVEALVSYSAAVGAKDTGKQQQARDELATFEKSMSTFLAGATSGRATPAQLQSALSDHDQMLMQHADAYGAKNYTSAHDIAYETYDHMFELARTLADAFGSAVAARLPAGGAQTGFGGEAAVVERH